MKSNEIRSRFIDYFERNGHLHLPSSSLVPVDDPTLLFTNAGMVPFKRVFLGEQNPPGPRAVTSQKCLRVSGKHNDLEEVGVTARHHTFFEMLGNFSFGEYFKRDAIRYAWAFVTDELGLPPERLWATVHHGDDEAHDLWLEETELPPGRVLRLGDKENFWQMGDTGPCGPCSEIHYDQRADISRSDLDPEEFLALGDADEFMEIWNLVFMQFQRDADGHDLPLPKPSIDTGAGLERIAAVMQGTRTNYHTDLFLPIIEAAEEIVGRVYPREEDRWDEGLPFRVLADHARAVAFLLADGVFPSNEGRGYVLRRILRRAARYAWLLGRREPTLDKLTGVVADLMSDVYPELDARRQHLLKATREEEESFLATIDEAMVRFEDIAPEGSGGTIAGAEAFKLYDTFGFPLDLTQLMAAERGYEVDVAGFDAALEEQRERSRSGHRKLIAEVQEALQARDAAHAGGSAHLTAIPSNERIAESLSPLGEQSWIGYEALAKETDLLSYARVGDFHAFVLKDNPFYVEAGGQVGDAGTVSGDGWRVRVRTVFRDDEGYTVVAGPLEEGELGGAPDVAVADVDERLRRDTQRNHTATHLLHAALRAVLGDHVHQAGSLVAPDRLRFDFNHRGPLSAEDRATIERMVNEGIWANVPVVAGREPYRDALASGAMALFGEKYDDEVRVIRLPGLSAELCGGCHVQSTGEIGLFKITHETGVAAGIRRIEAVTGPEAYGRVEELEDLVKTTSDTLGVQPDKLAERAVSLVSEHRALQVDVAADLEARATLTASAVVEGADSPTARNVAVDGGRILTREGVQLEAGSDLTAFGDSLRQELSSGVAILHVIVRDDAEDDGVGKEAFLSVVTDDWVKRGVKAGDLVRVASKTTGSGGGGRPHLAQGGVGDRDLVPQALEAALDLVTRTMAS